MNDRHRRIERLKKQEELRKKRKARVILLDFVEEWRKACINLKNLFDQIGRSIRNGITEDPKDLHEKSAEDRERLK